MNLQSTFFFLPHIALGLVWFDHWVSKKYSPPIICPYLKLSLAANVLFKKIYQMYIQNNEVTGGSRGYAKFPEESYQSFRSWIKQKEWITKRAFSYFFSLLLRWSIPSRSAFGSYANKTKRLYIQLAEPDTSKRNVTNEESDKRTFLLWTKKF